MTLTVRISLLSVIVLTTFVQPAALDWRRAAPQSSVYELRPGESHTHAISLPPGGYFSATIEQYGIDVALAVRANDGTMSAQSFSPLGADGRKRFHFVSESGGAYVFQLTAANPKARSGKYALSPFTFGAAGSRERRLVRAQQAVYDGERLRREGKPKDSAAVLRAAAKDFLDAEKTEDAADAAVVYLGLARAQHILNQSRESLDSYQTALELFRKAADRHGEAMALYRVGSLLQLLEPARAPDYLSRAPALARELGNQYVLARLSADAGYQHWLGNDLPAALGKFEDALTIYAALGYSREEAEMLTFIGSLQTQLGNHQQGLEIQKRAVQLHRDDGNSREEANALIALGDAYLRLGEVELAEDALNRALDLSVRGEFQQMQAYVLPKLGDLQLSLDRRREALESFSRALTLVETGVPALLPRVQKGLGQCHAALGDQGLALMFFEQAQQGYQKLKQYGGLAEVFFERGRIFFGGGQVNKALGEWEQALSVYRQGGEPLGMARTLTAMADAQLALKQTAPAVEYNDEALKLLESLRDGLASYQMRASFFAIAARVYERKIDLLMTRHRAQPQAGFDREGFNFSERARARSLLEMLHESRLAGETQVDAALLANLRRAQQAIDDEASRRVKLEADPAAKNELAKNDARLRELTQQLDQIRGRIRLANPRYAELTQTQPLTCAEVQPLLDADSVLLEFALGEERSFLWAVTADAVQVYELPRRALIEKAAVEFHEMLSRRASSAAFLPKAGVLTRLLFGGMAFGKKRLIIVAPEALQYVPFAALPSPSKSETAVYEPLIVNHEIVALPSASVIPALRRDTAQRAAAARQLAIFANPVFEYTDSRVRPSAQAAVKPLSSSVETSALNRAMGSAVGKLAALPSTQYEAEQILSLVSPAESLPALGFQASKSLALSPELGQYRMLHFATHGLLDKTHSELSGLVFSLVNEQGAPQNGYLRLHEIYNLRLNADLVALSACQTGLGKQIRGEGLIGLTRGFMFAGAPRVVASLWQVNDLSTAELMKRFYRAMLKDGLSPAAALRAAQLELFRKKENPAWQSPYAWAAFVMQGDWRAARK